MRLALLLVGLTITVPSTAQAPSPAAEFRPVPELAYRVDPAFFIDTKHLNAGEASGVAVNSKGHIFLFQRVEPMLAEYDQNGRFIRSLGQGLFTHPHGLRIDRDDNIWITDDESHLVLKLSPDGHVLLVLGRRNMAAEADWLFNQPTDVAFGRNGEIYVADGYGNSRIVKFDRNGRFMRTWGRYGVGPGEFNLPHSVAVDAQGHVYVGDRENRRIQIFNEDGKFLTQWTNVGYPYGLTITPDQHVWMVDGGYDRIIELDPNGTILGAIAEPGHEPGQLAWGHFLAITSDRKILVADVLNWRFQAFVPAAPTGKLTAYVPSRRMYWDRAPSTGWSTRTTDKKN